MVGVYNLKQKEVLLQKLCKMDKYLRWEKDMVMVRVFIKFKLRLIDEEYTLKVLSHSPKNMASCKSQT